MIEHSSWTLDAAVSETNLHFDIDRIQEAVGSVGLSLKAAISPSTWLRIESLPVTDGMKSVLNALRFEASASSRPCALTIDSLATALLSMILRQAGARPPADNCAIPIRSGVRRAAERMRASPSQDHSLEELAATAGLSRFHFLRAFRKEHGLPPHGFLLSLRLERAAELIRETELSLTTIAYEAGFGSSSRLTEAFQRRFGVAPSLWRKGARPRRECGGYRGGPASTGRGAEEAAAGGAGGAVRAPRIETAFVSA